MFDIAVKNHRKTHSLTQGYMANLLGLTRFGYSSLEAGTSVPSRPISENIMKVLNIESEYSVEQLRILSQISVSITLLQKSGVELGVIFDLVSQIIEAKQ